MLCDSSKVLCGPYNLFHVPEDMLRTIQHDPWLMNSALYLEHVQRACLVPIVAPSGNFSHDCVGGGDSNGCIPSRW